MTEVKSEITASVWLVNVAVGDTVVSGAELVVLESMKMEIPVHAPIDGTIAEVMVAPGDTVQEGATLIVIQS